MGFPQFWSTMQSFALLFVCYVNPLCIQLFSVLSTRAYFSDDPRSRVRLNHTIFPREARPLE